MIAVILADIPTPVDVVKAGVGAVGGFIADQAADTFLEPVGHAIARGLAGAAKKVADEVLHFITSSATVRFDQGWWAGDRAQTLVSQIGVLALVLTLGFLLLALIQGLVAGDPAAMLRAAMLEVPVTMAGTVALVAITQLLLGLVDGASSMVLAGVPEALGHFFGGFGEVATIETNGFAGILMVVAFLIGAILVWIELVVRSSLIYLLVAAAPLTLAARVWPAARGAWRRLAEIGVALIVSKFAIALALGLGAAALAGGGPKEGDLGTQVGMDLGSMLTGASLMLLAAFTPFIVLKLLPIVEGAIVAQGISRSPTRAAQSGMQAGYYAQGLARMAGGRAGASRPAAAGPDGGGNPPGAPSAGGPTARAGSGPGASGAARAPAAGPVGGAGAGSTASHAGSATGAGVGGTAAAAGAGAVALPVGAMAVASTTARRASSAASAAGDRPREEKS